MIDEMGDFRRTKRQLAWDMISHEQMYEPEIQERFGLAPASEEVLDMEHDDSDKRLESLLPFYPRLKALAAMGSGIAHRAILSYHGEDDLVTEYEAAVFGTVAVSLAQAVVSGLLSEGWISLSVPEEAHDV